MYTFSKFELSKEKEIWQEKWCKPCVEGVEIGDLKSARWQILRVKNDYGFRVCEICEVSVGIDDLRGPHPPPGGSPGGPGGSTPPPGGVTGKPYTSNTPISGRFGGIHKLKDRKA